MENQMVTKDIMTPKPITVKEHQPLYEVIDILRRNMISGAPVLDAAGDMTGMITLRDIAFNGLWGVSADGPDEDKVGYFVQGNKTPFNAEDWKGLNLELYTDVTVEQIMTPVIFRVDHMTPVKEVAETMLRGKIHRLVVTENNRPVGIVTTTDLLKVICDVEPTTT